MKPEDFYITQEEYEAAAKNGVRPALLETRIRRLAWDKARAISTPPHEKKSLKEWVAIAEQNGICYSTLRERVNQLGWDPEIAATKPLQDRKAQAKRASEKSRKYPPAIVEMAKRNGIHYHTFRGRVKAGWDMELAATRPTMTGRECGLLTKTKLRWRLNPGQLKAAREGLRRW